MYLELYLRSDSQVIAPLHATDSLNYSPFAISERYSVELPNTYVHLYKEKIISDLGVHKYTPTKEVVKEDSSVINM